MTYNLREVHALALSPEGFGPFGKVVSAGLGVGRDANQGTAVRFDFCAELLNTRPQARANLAVFRSVAKRLPFDVELLERHPCSTQVFIPMIVSSYLVCVAESDANGVARPETLQAFICGPGQGVAYAPGTWHHPVVALDGPGEFAMLVWEDGSPKDCELLSLSLRERVRVRAVKSIN